jgi:hypothetical protein|tara:strand:+ start:201 stop:605 length:405 start_codon:yes stop_codon:yes gene_type:complete
MFKPKMVFTALSVWFLFHLVIFFIVAPSMLKDMPDMSEKALFMSSSMMQSSGILMGFLGVFMYLCRDLKLEEAKKFLLTSGGLLVLMDIIIIRDELAAIEKYPNDPAMHTPIPAIAIFLLLTIYTLYVALIVKE